MAGMPSDIAGSALQAGLQQNTAGGIQDNEHNRRVNSAREAAQRAAQRENDVVGDENSMTVNADAGGGGQGRDFSETPTEENAQTTEPTDHGDQSGITTDEDGQTHIDLEA